MDPSVISAGATVPGEGWRQEPSVASLCGTEHSLTSRAGNEGSLSEGPYYEDLLLVESNYTSTFTFKTLC